MTKKLSNCVYNHVLIRFRFCNSYKQYDVQTNCELHFTFDRYKRLDLRKTRPRSSFWKIANTMSKKKKIHVTNSYISACREFQFYDTSICQYMYFVFPQNQEVISTSSFLNWMLTRFHYSYCRNIMLQLFLFRPFYNGCIFNISWEKDICQARIQKIFPGGGSNLDV